jgi:hypothetical protein
LSDAGSASANTFLSVYRAMVRQIAREFPFSLSDLRTITDAEIRFFYDILRPDLQRATKSKSK